MTPKERQAYAERFLIQRFAELTTEVSEPVTFTVEQILRLVSFGHKTTFQSR